MPESLGRALLHTDHACPARGDVVSPRRDRPSAEAPLNGAREPMTRPSSAHRTARRDSASASGSARSDQRPPRCPWACPPPPVSAGVEEGFRLAHEIGYDGMEVMVSYPKDSQDPDLLREYSQRYGLPILSLHAPTLFFLQGLWGRDAWVRTSSAPIEIAEELKVPTIVAHPPFTWQGECSFRGGSYRRAEGGARHRDRGGEHVPVAPGGAGAAELPSGPRSDGRGSTRTSPSISRTPRPRATTRWR